MEELTIYLEVNMWSDPPKWPPDLHRTYPISYIMAYFLWKVRLCIKDSKLTTADHLGWGKHVVRPHPGLPHKSYGWCAPKFNGHTRGVTKYLLQKLVNFHGNFIHFVTDKWMIPSIKDLERQERESTAFPYQIKGPGQKRPGNWREALTNLAFKESRF